VKITALYNREDARRMAKTMVTLRREQGEPLPDVSTRRMKKIPANVLSKFAARPEAFRTARLISATDSVVVLRIGGAF